MTLDENRCIFCDQIYEEGIRLRGKFICKACEEELLKIQVDEPAYDTYKEGIKIIWTGQIPRKNPDTVTLDPEDSSPV